MSTPALHPFAAHYRVLYARLASTEEQRQMLAELLDSVGRGCAAAGAALIGHIKAFAVQPGGGYLAGSLTSASAPSQVEARDLQASQQLDVDLAALVYGLEREQLAQIVDQAWQALAEMGLIRSARLLVDHPEGLPDP